MKQLAFEQAHRDDWSSLGQLLSQLERAPNKVEPSRLANLPDRYTRLCNQYTLARDRGYSAALVSELQHLVQRGHQQLYRSARPVWSHLLNFIAADFPRALRRRAGFFWAATLLFYLPAVLMGLWCAIDSDALHSIMAHEQVRQMEYAYDPGNEHTGRGPERQADTDVQMFGFYIYNNVAIGFRTFAGGVFLGLGTLFFLLYNGVLLGGVAGHLTGLGYVDTFWGFVAGHGSFELTAVCISGMAGLMLGYALIAPGNRSRVQALKLAAREAAVLISGAAMFFVAAAFVEAFWSPADFPVSVKYGVAACLWALVIGYLAFAGRGHHGPR